MSTATSEPTDLDGHPSVDVECFMEIQAHDRLIRLPFKDAMDLRDRLVEAAAGLPHLKSAI
jgi:hypothetical protein